MRRPSFVDVYAARAGNSFQCPRSCRTTSTGACYFSSLSLNCVVVVNKFQLLPNWHTAATRIFFPPRSRCCPFLRLESIYFLLLMRTPALVRVLNFFGWAPSAKWNFSHPFWCSSSRFILTCFFVHPANYLKGFELFWRPFVRSGFYICVADR